MTTKRKPKTGVKQAIPGAGRGGVVPPPENRFKAGAPSPNPHGRPRRLKDLQELIRATLAEEVGGLTRAEVLVRTMLIKSPGDRIALLEYAFGKVPSINKEQTWEDEVIEFLAEGKITEQQVHDELPEYAESLIARARLRRNEDGAMAGQSS